MLVKCPECSREISDSAPSCPHCGFVQKAAFPDLKPGAASSRPADGGSRTPVTPIFLLAAGVAFFLALFTPRIVAVLPILGAVILAVVSLVRREPFKVAAFGVIVFSIGLFVLSSSDFSSHVAHPSTISGPDGAPALSFNATRCEQDSGYMIAEGTVTNNTTEALKDVAAVVSFNDASGKLVTSEDSLIEYNPILAGQTSPFKVMATYNPAMATCSVSFKELMGGEISSQSH